MFEALSAFELLPEFALELAPSESERLALAECFAKLSALTDADPSALSRGRARLLAAVAESSERFAPLFGKLRDLFDLPPEALRSIFTRAAVAEAWQPGPLPSVSLFHLQGGPRVAGLDAGFVRLKKGTPFPAHRHTATERVLILEGGYHDHAGRWYGPGEMHEMLEGTEHSLQMGAEQDVLLAVVLSGEVEVLGT
ncbi:MAG: cupin domain-containing protein [Pseudomonadota bacterium]